MFKDEIVEEIHRIREEYSRSFNHDLKAIFADFVRVGAAHPYIFDKILSKRRS